VYELNRLKPINRHLTIIPHVKKNETNSGVLLPDDYEEQADQYIEATVIDVANDCNSEIKSLSWGKINPEKKILVERSMVKEIKLKDRTHYLILENYVVGIFRGTNED
tara:strand:+ start:1041 stop:1364 length:324 start_codon:yes stop_codon:yes gene_type:complete